MTLDPVRLRGEPTKPTLCMTRVLDNPSYTHLLIRKTNTTNNVWFLPPGPRTSLVPATTLPSTVPAILRLHMPPPRSSSSSRGPFTSSLRPQSTSSSRQISLTLNITIITRAKNPTLPLVTDRHLLPPQPLLPDHRSLSALLAPRPPPSTKLRSTRFTAPRKDTTFPIRFVTSTMRLTPAATNHLLRLDMVPPRITAPPMGVSTRTRRTSRVVIGSTPDPPTAIAGTRASPSPRESGYPARFQGTGIIPPQIRLQRCGGIPHGSTRVWQKAVPVVPTRLPTIAPLVRGPLNDLLATTCGVADRRPK